ncbi:MAG: NADH-quinone oxidoreductase subunit G [Propionibacteriaceae bacterium]|jgi:NADH-quinone oxidoreductase subunit G|nr:NADH-quinone oxidoreductase subunit G [Propionibacteriaceae bacterium]
MSVDPTASPKQITLTIDGIQVSVAQGTTVLRAAEQAGVFIPRFCDHPLLKPLGACRQCMVEVPDAGNGRPLKLQTSCTLEVAEGMKVATQATSELAADTQAGVMELLLVNHPLDCPECDKAGECPLQNQAMLSPRQVSRFDGVKRTWPKPVPVTPTVMLDQERCIGCQRCTRFSAEISGDPLFVMLGRGAETHLAICPDAGSGGYFAGNAVQLCPVGALTSSDYRFQARPFELISTQSTCDGCAAGCQLRVDVKNGRVVRRLAGDDPSHNDEWLCDRGRYGFRSTQAADRLRTPLLRVDGQLVEVSWPEALDAAAKGLRGLTGSQVAVLPGGRLTLENAYAYARFAHTVLLTNNIDYRGRAFSDEETKFLAREQAGRTPAQLVDYAALERAKRVVLVCFEPEEESPMVFLRLRRAVRRSGLQVLAVAPYLSAGSRKLGAKLIACAPGEEAQSLTALGHTIDRDTVLLVGERAATAAGALKRAVDVTTASGAKLAWIPRRPGELAAIVAGCLPTLLPGGRAVTDAGARADLMAEWHVAKLPTSVGYDLAGIAVAANAGEVRAIVTGALDLRDLPDAGLMREALERTFVVSLEVRRSEVVQYADVVFPVAASDEQDGTFIDWTHSRRPVNAALSDQATPPDVRVLAAISQALGSNLGFHTTAAALASYDALSRWFPNQQMLPAITAADPPPSVPGNAILASWRQLVDDAAILDGATALRDAAPAAVARMSQATAAATGLNDGAIAQIGAGGTWWRGPVQVTPGMVDGVVWVPTLSDTATHGRLNALPGERVILTKRGISLAGSLRGGDGA